MISSPSPHLSGSRAADRVGSTFHTLSTGTQVVVLSTPQSAVVSAQCFFRGGKRLETADRVGICQLVARLMTRGTTTRSAASIAEYLESMGATLSTQAEADYVLISLKCLAEDFPPLVIFVLEMLRSLAWDARELEKIREDTLYGLLDQQENAFQIAYAHIQPLLYGDHPYGLPLLGTAEMVRALQSDDLRPFYDRYFRPDCLTLALAGNITPEKVIPLLEAALSPWPMEGLAPKPCVALATFNPQHHHIDRETEQAWLMLGYPAPSIQDHHYFACKLINAHLGNGSSSRLFVELREKKGLVYDASAFFPSRLDRSQLVVYLSTSAENMGAAHQLLQMECDRLLQDSIAPDALQLAKNKLIGNYVLGKQTPAQIAHMLGWYTTLGLSTQFDHEFTDRVAALTAEDLLAAAQAYLIQPAITIVG